MPAYPYARLLDCLAERAHARGAVLASAGVDAGSFARHGGYLSLPQVEALVARACALAPELAAEVGARISPMGLGALGTAIVSAATVGDALRVVADHFGLICPLFDASVDAHAEGLVLRFVARWDVPTAIERWHASFCASLCAHVLHRLAPGAQEPQIEAHGIRVGTALAEQLLPLGDARVHGEALRQCRTQLDARPDPTEIAASVRRVLFASGAPFPDLDGIAKRLATSGRSLRRRLREEGTSFRSLLDEVRSSLADAWLVDPRRSITEIGLDLGYTDAANFARAYRRTTGRSPSAARRERLGFAVAS